MFAYNGIPEKVKNAAVRKVAKGIEVSWIPNEMKAVDGYSIYRVAVDYEITNT